MTKSKTPPAITPALDQRAGALRHAFALHDPISEPADRSAALRRREPGDDAGAPTPLPAAPARLTDPEKE